MHTSHKDPRPGSPTMMEPLLVVDEDGAGSYVLISSSDTNGKAKAPASIWGLKRWLLLGCFCFVLVPLMLLQVAGGGFSRWPRSIGFGHLSSLWTNLSRQKVVLETTRVVKPEILASEVINHSSLAANESFLLPLRLATQLDPRAVTQVFCLRRSNVGKPFLIHQEVLDGPRVLSEALFAVEYLRNAQQVFRFHDTSLDALDADEHDEYDNDDGNNDQLLLFRDDPRETIPPRARKMYKRNHFGERIASFIKIRLVLQEDTDDGDDLVCFDALKFLQVTVPLAVSPDQMDLLPPDLKTVDFTMATTNNSPLRALLPEENFLNIKVFPRNTMVVSSWIDSQLGEWSFAASFCLLPAREMPKRAWDERVGFFLLRSMVQDDPFPYKMNYIQRQRLEQPIREFEASDNDADEVHRNDRIVFFIDPSVPEHWHPVIKQGVLAWNEAFTPLFDSAVGTSTQVIECIAPDEPGFPENFHLSDVRFNVVSWVPKQEHGFSVTHFIVDPRSGECLSAKVFMDSSHASSIFNQIAMQMVALQDENRLHQAAEILTAFQPSQQPFVGDPSISPIGSLQQSILLEEELRVLLLPSDSPQGQEASTNELARAFSDCMSEVVTHEVGHALGLRHNFLGSTQNSFAQNGDLHFLRQHGVTSSVMDYLPVNTRSSKHPPTSSTNDSNNLWFCQTRIGEYDKWAIKYGYSFDDSKLEDIASQQLAFQSDEDYISNFSLVMRYDLGDNPLDFYQDQMQLVADTQAHLLSLAAVFGPILPEQQKPLQDSLWKVEKALIRLLDIHFQGIIRFIGGRQAMMDQNHVQVLPTSRDKQLQALEIVLGTLSLASNVAILPDTQTSQLFVEKVDECDQLKRRLCHGGFKPDHEAYLLDHFLIPAVKNLMDHDRLGRMLASSSDHQPGQVHGLQVNELVDCCFAIIWGMSDIFVCGIGQLGSSQVYSIPMLHSIQLELVEQLILAVHNAQSHTKALEEQLLTSLVRFRSALVAKIANKALRQQQLAASDDELLTLVHWKLTLSLLDKHLVSVV